MRAERDALIAELAQLRQRHDLEPAGIGEDRVRPVHEAVQSAERRDPLGARTQHQVVGIAKDDIAACGPDLLGTQTLDGRLGTDRHEGRRAHDAVGGRYLAAARLAVGRQ